MCSPPCKLVMPNYIPYFPSPAVFHWRCVKSRIPKQLGYLFIQRLRKRLAVVPTDSRVRVFGILGDNDFSNRRDVIVSEPIFDRPEVGVAHWPEARFLQEVLYGPAVGRGTLAAVDEYHLVILRADVVGVTPPLSVVGRYSLDNLAARVLFLSDGAGDLYIACDELVVFGHGHDAGGRPGCKYLLVAEHGEKSIV